MINFLPFSRAKASLCFSTVRVKSKDPRLKQSFQIDKGESRNPHSNVRALRLELLKRQRRKGKRGPLPTFALCQVTTQPLLALLPKARGQNEAKNPRNILYLLNKKKVKSIKKIYG